MSAQLLRHGLIDCRALGCNQRIGQHLVQFGSLGFELGRSEARQAASCSSQRARWSHRCHRGRSHWRLWRLCSRAGGMTRKRCRKVPGLVAGPQEVATVSEGVCMHLPKRSHRCGKRICWQNCDCGRSNKSSLCAHGWGLMPKSWPSAICGPCLRQSADVWLGGVGFVGAGGQWMRTKNVHTARARTICMSPPMAECALLPCHRRRGYKTRTKGKVKGVRVTRKHKGRETRPPTTCFSSSNVA